ncbi:DUF1449 domain-containing protein [Photobacterium sp. WH77]|uniref:DUF1449 domain-containing protein n=1 Tax=unclassified Photobacterium TaxID=2628852 RepID=UPI001EDACD74|nr:MULTISPECIES: DUF1449 domain-containing protein [unclassified Photobacterium]MCG2836099.1 DUF1449 domain-containing protein [Photobacterium sp. WH77]MCG2843764.1 DUF1449 domain-containing protein [Photobacterium sp. WH80]
MTIQEMISILLSFPTNVFFVPFVIFLVIMLVDLVFNIVESVAPDVDLFDAENIPGAGLILPPILSKVPLMVALCVSFFVGTIVSFYLVQALNAVSEASWMMVVEVVSIPFTAYLALFIAAWLLKPLAPLFDKKRSFAKVDFIGLKGRVHSSLVNQNRGEVVVQHNGSEFLLDVRVIEPEISMEYGDEVIIVSQDKTTNHYIVAKNS